MTKPLVVYPAVEPIVVDHLKDLMVGDVDDPTVGVGVPVGWTPGSAPHLQVADDGTWRIEHPVAAWSTVRVVARAGSTTVAQRLAHRAMGALLAGGEPAGVTITAATGPLPARDTSTRAEMAWFTVRVRTRSAPPATSSS
jgi:hypothetical protein